MSQAETHLSVDLKPDISGTSVLVHAAYRKNLDDQHLALLNGNVHLLPNARLSKEISSGYDADEDYV